MRVPAEQEEYEKGRMDKNLFYPLAELSFNPKSQQKPGFRASGNKIGNVFFLKKKTFSLKQLSSMSKE